MLGDEVMAAALIDRLLHHCHIINIRGNSYRMRAHQNLLVGLPPSSAAWVAQHDCHPSVLPESVQFSIFKSEQFSIDIDRGRRRAALLRPGVS